MVYGLPRLRPDASSVVRAVPRQRKEQDSSFSEEKEAKRLLFLRRFTLTQENPVANS
jgi:hypothetical protein